MSRDIKYIGLDVHKEAIVIAVLNGSSNLWSAGRVACDLGRRDVGGLAV